MLLNDVKWEKPVTISLQNGAPRIFNGVYEAFDFLQHEWPARGDKAHEQALRLCRASLMGDVAGEIARTAFVAASSTGALPDGGQGGGTEYDRILSVFTTDALEGHPAKSGGLVFLR